MTCHRCHEQTPRLTLTQTHCPRCEAEVRALIEADTKRRTRFRFAKALDWSAA